MSEQKIERKIERANGEKLGHNKKRLKWKEEKTRGMSEGDYYRRDVDLGLNKFLPHMTQIPSPYDTSSFPI